jgi:hypothetical protein
MNLVLTKKVNDMIEVRSADVSCNILMTKVPNHDYIKQEFLKLLENIPIIGVDDRHLKKNINKLPLSQKISNTDFFYSNHKNSAYLKYRDLVSPIFDRHNQKITEYLQYGYPILTANMWFQQYSKNDYHGWHRHCDCIFSNVYYVDLSSNSSRTTFRHNGTEFELDVEEGMIITFPSFLEHCSKPNMSDYTKTVISFNSN